MSENPIITKMREEVELLIQADVNELEKTTDIVKQVEITHQIRIKLFKHVMKATMKLSKKEFDEFINAFFEPAENQFTDFVKQEEKIAFRNSQNPEEFDQYKKLRELELTQNNEMIDLLNEYDLDVEQMRRMFVFFVSAAGYNEIQNRMINLQFNELFQASLLVNRQFGFDVNWLIGEAMAQLHENLIKKKYTDLLGDIPKNKIFYELIPDLINAIKEKENRDVKISLELSSGLKRIRNMLSHEGFKYQVTKENLQEILQETKKLETTLYPEKNEK